jgi:hypothetical protein
MRAFFSGLSHFFSCKWEVRNVQPMLAQVSPVVGAMWGFDSRQTRPEPVTQVLQVCKVCGKLRTETLHGNWTMNDLVGGLPDATA